MRRKRELLLVELKLECSPGRKQERGVEKVVGADEREWAMAPA